LAYVRDCKVGCTLAIPKELKGQREDIVIFDFWHFLNENEVQRVD